MGGAGVKSWKRLAARALFVVLASAPAVQAQDTGTTGGPVFCPPFTTHLTPTLLDVFIYPTFTDR
jgi:hypothetical protein